MNNRYCYWSVATGPHAGFMEQCVASARRCGVFKEFHVLTDRTIDGCECYDAGNIDMAGGFFKLIYLKAGISKLLFDYFIWIDADSLFTRQPRNLLDCLRRSPIHVPLTANLRSAPQDAPLGCMTVKSYIELLSRAGVSNPVYHSGSAFWIVQRDAINRVVELATYFRAFASEAGCVVDVSACLGYAMQMLCANPEAHHLSAHQDVWASDDRGQFDESAMAKAGWRLSEPLTGAEWQVNPAIVHLSRSRRGRIQPQLSAGEDIVLQLPAESGKEEFASVL